MKQFEICEYKQDQQRFKEFYVDMQTKRRTSRVLHALRYNKGTKTIWQAGLVCILGIYISQWKQLPFSLKHSSFLVVGGLVWSSIVGIIGFQYVGHQYDEELLSTCETIADKLGQIKSGDKSNAWIMTNNDDHVVGTVAFKVEGDEGQIGYLTGLDSNIRLQLVQHALNFGKSKDIQVISKWKQATFESKWSQ
jgi:hypothetical protein